MYVKPLFIFDLDGTLALIDHRRAILDSEDPDKWSKFFEACDKDQPNLPVVRILSMIRLHADVWVFSGRSEQVRAKTLAWLNQNTTFNVFNMESFGELMMRPADDFRPDEVLKREWYDRMLQCDRDRLVAVFDDRDKVVAMWRALGVACFQVAPGNF